MAPGDIMAGSEKQAKPKPIISAGKFLGWYYGNFLMSPANALRDEERYVEKAHALIDGLRVELKGQKMTHKQFLDLMKEKGVHAQFYRYQQPKPTNCPWCRILGSG